MDACLGRIEQCKLVERNVFIPEGELDAIGMQEMTNHEWAELLSAEPIPPEHNPLRKLVLGFLDPSEMTPEERMEELASI